MLAMQSVTAAYAGQVRRARELTESAIDLAVSRGLEQGASLYSAGDALWEAAYGDCAAARRTAARTLDLSRGRTALSWSALALAICGESSAAQRLLDEMTRRFPHDSFFKSSWVPMTQAALEIRGGNAAQAIALLQTPGRCELGTQTALWPAYLRGLAYLEQGAANEALAEFQKILDHKGVLAPKDFNPVAMTLYPLAHVGRARAATLAGDVEEGREAYGAFLALWKDADSDIPVLLASEREYRQPGMPGPHVTRPRESGP
jgi:tetratricopeptide (TPR) repeat protein